MQDIESDTVYDTGRRSSDGADTTTLAQRGHSRAGKKGTLQIVFGLLCTAEGCPVAVEVFKGSAGRRR